jgi:hypothetical protein
MPSSNGLLFIIKLKAKYKFHACTPLAALFCILQRENEKSCKIKDNEEEEERKRRNPSLKKLHVCQRPLLLLCVILGHLS